MVKTPLCDVCSSEPAAQFVGIRQYAGDLMDGQFHYTCAGCWLSNQDAVCECENCVEAIKQHVFMVLPADVVSLIEQYRVTVRHDLGVDGRGYDGPWYCSIEPTITHGSLIASGATVLEALEKVLVQRRSR